MNARAVAIFSMFTIATLGAPCSAGAQAASLATPSTEAVAPVTTEAEPAPVSPAPVACSEGRDVGPTTYGRCCWPGQSFSIERGRCEGPPSCDAGWVSHGDDCVAARAPSIAPSVVESTVTATAEPLVAVPTPIETTRSIRHGLVGAGASFLIAGYVAAVTYGLTFGPSFFWLGPVVGPLVGVGLWPQSWANITMGVVTAGFQIAGLIMLIVGGSDHREITLDATSGVTLELLPVPTLHF